VKPFCRKFAKEEKTAVTISVRMQGLLPDGACGFPWQPMEIV